MDPFLFLAHRIDFGFAVLDVVIDNSSTLIVLAGLLLSSNSSGFRAVPWR